MAATNTSRLKTPGVYIEEIRTFPPSIAAVDTAIPAFIGYTEKAFDRRGENTELKPLKIESMLDYVRFFGEAQPEESIEVRIKDNNGDVEVFGKNNGQSVYAMAYSLQLFFANGGGECYIVSVGDYETGLIGRDDLKKGLDATETVDEITLYVFPDAQGLDSVDDYYGIYTDAINLCAELQDRFTVMDVYQNEDDPSLTDDIEGDNGLRSKLGSDDRLRYGAAYYPNLETTIDLWYGGEGVKDENVKIISVGGDWGPDLKALKGIDNALYFRARSAVRNIPTILPPSPAIVGVYTSVDDSRGVWKAPANVSLASVIKPRILLTDSSQGNLNIDSTAGKSVNVIRSFKGRGIMVWGARTLAGNDNEWRYVSVRRFFNMVEESAKKATFQFVFEPNDVNTWTRVKSMIENFLTLQWRAGALQGATTDQAYFVNVGLGETMTALDVLEGRMIVEIGMAVVRPAEFIVLQFMHKLPEA